MNRVIISDFKDIGKVLNIIHDQYFEKEDIKFNAKSQTLEIKFERLMYEKAKIVKNLLLIRKYQCPVVEFILKINFVETYQVKARESFGMFNTIRYDAEKKLIVIVSDIPITIKIRVTKFHIEVVDTGKILGTKTYWTPW